MKTTGLKILLITLIGMTGANANDRFISGDNIDFIIDTETKLVWQNKPLDYNVNITGDNQYRKKQSLCSLQNISGITGWRLPTLEEARTLYNSGINFKYIPNANSNIVTSTLKQGKKRHSGYGTWRIGYDYNSNEENFYSDDYFFYDTTRCVLGGSEDASYNKLIAIAKEEKKALEDKRMVQIKNAFQDKDSALIWQDDEEAKTLKMEWRFAKEYCEKKGDGWRLPTTEELETLIEIKDGKPNLNKKLKNVSMRKYWSSKQTAAFTFQTLNFHYKNLGDIGNTNEQYGDVNVRCVKDMK